MQMARTLFPSIFWKTYVQSLPTVDLHPWSLTAKVLEKWCLENDPFLLGFGPSLRENMLVLGRVYHPQTDSIGSFCLPRWVRFLPDTGTPLNKHPQINENDLWSFSWMSLKIKPSSSSSLYIWKLLLPGKPIYQVTRLDPFQIYREIGRWGKWRAFFSHHFHPSFEKPWAGLLGYFPRPSARHPLLQPRPSVVKHPNVYEPPWSPEKEIPWAGSFLWGGGVALGGIYL